MPPTTSSRLTSTAALILERTRVVSLGLTPSPSTDTKIVRALRQVRDELAARPGGEACEEEWDRWETLVGMMREDEVGRQQAKGLERPVVVPCVWVSSPGVSRLMRGFVGVGKRGTRTKKNRERRRKRTAIDRKDTTMSRTATQKNQRPRGRTRLSRQDRIQTSPHVALMQTWKQGTNKI